MNITASTRHRLDDRAAAVFSSRGVDDLMDAAGLIEKASKAEMS